PRHDADWAAVAGMGRDVGREIRDRIEREVVDHVQRVTRHASRHASRQAKRAERRARKIAERAARRDEWRREWRGGAVPWFIVVLVGLALTIAQLAVLIATRVVVPTVLVLLSLVLGRRLRDAARAVSEAGARAHDAMG